MRRIALVLLLSACAPTSYTRATTARMVAADRWIIRVHGKRIDPALMLEYQQRKAGEVCPTGFVVEQTAGGEETTGYIVTSSNTAVPVKRTDSATVVRCE